MRRSTIIDLEELGFAMKTKPDMGRAPAQNRPGSDEALSIMEKALLEYLRKNAGRTLSREELAEQVWKRRHYYRSRTIDQTVSKLRKKLRSRDGRIFSVWAFGYRYEHHRDSAAPARPLPKGNALSRFRTAQKFSVAA